MTIHRHLRQPLLACFVLALLMLQLSGCSHLNTDLREPELSLVSFSHDPGSNIQQRFSLRLKIRNPNDIALDLKSLVFDFNIDDYELLSGASYDIPRVPAHGAAEFTIHASARKLDTLRLFHELMLDPKARFRYTLNATVELKTGWPSTFHLRKDGDIDLLQAAGKH